MILSNSPVSVGWSFLVLLCFSPIINNTLATTPPRVPFLKKSPPSPPPLQHSPPPSPPPPVVNRTWTTDACSENYTDGSEVWHVCTPQGPNEPIQGPSFGCGLYCKGDCTSFLFSVFSIPEKDRTNMSTSSPWIVWSANRNNPVKGNASLVFTEDGDLRLCDIHGKVWWSSNTSGRSVQRIDVTGTGNLKIVGTNGTVWQSFDHPTDTVLPDQPLAGKKLFANISATNSSEGEFYLNITSNSFDAIVQPNNQSYYSTTSDAMAKVQDGVLLSLSPSNPGTRTTTTYMMLWRLEADGHLRSYEWSDQDKNWINKEDKLHFAAGDCAYPTKCGDYGVCVDGECIGCMKFGESKYFELRDENRPQKGCSELTNLTCTNTQLLPYPDISYYGYNVDTDVVEKNTTLETCKEKCSSACYCKGAFFRYSSSTYTNQTRGDCYLPSTMHTVYQDSKNNIYSSAAFIKVQLPTPEKSSWGRWAHKKIIIGSTMGAVFCIMLVGFCVVLMWVKKKKKEARERERIDEEEHEFSKIQGMPSRFSYQELEHATGKFSKKLGEGGFGAVFEGTLLNGTRVAVKVLGYKGQGKKQFVAEVETIGSVHHTNLVRLIGYCAEKLHRLLVYEFMSNGSLENWIYHDRENPILGWDTKFNIIHGVAKALSYLHEECRHRIIHLDIKPQNILLDDKLNARVSDFGLAKLIDRDQSQVFTTLRGTPGYMAPEWLCSIITEKVDVYSFGVVLLETVSGRRCLDNSRSPRSINLVNMLKKAEEEDNIAYVIDKSCSDVDYNEEMATKMLRLAIWCLQGDPNNRPSMSVVVKVLEGLTEVQTKSTMNFDPPSITSVGESSSSKEQMPSMISGPR